MFFDWGKTCILANGEESESIGTLKEGGAAEEAFVKDGGSVDVTVPRTEETGV